MSVESRCRVREGLRLKGLYGLNRLGDCLGLDQAFADGVAD
jgi:hypothetical protein